MGHVLFEYNDNEDSHFLYEIVDRTCTIELAMERSTMKVGIEPPGVLDVAMSHSVLPSSNSRIRSALVYRPLTPFSSSFANSLSAVTSIGIDTIVLQVIVSPGIKSIPLVR